MTFHSCIESVLVGFSTDCSFWPLLSGGMVTVSKPLWNVRRKASSRLCYFLSISQLLCCSISYTLGLIVLQTPLRNLIQPSFLLTTQAISSRCYVVKKMKRKKNPLTRCRPYKYYHTGVWKGISSPNYANKSPLDNSTFQNSYTHFFKNVINLKISMVTFCQLTQLHLQTYLKFLRPRELNNLTVISTENTKE